jgi:hypothetical protein
MTSTATSLDDIKDMIIILHKTIETINDKIEVINKKLDENTELIYKKIDEDISDECKKMGSHIDFIEGVYDKMKYPLNYLCNTINNISNNNQICDNNSK